MTTNQIKCWFFGEKNLSEQSREPTNLTHMWLHVGQGIETQPTLVEGKCSHHCTKPAYWLKASCNHCAFPFLPILISLNFTCDDSCQSFFFPLKWKSISTTFTFTELLLEIIHLSEDIIFLQITWQFLFPYVSSLPWNLPNNDITVLPDCNIIGPRGPLFALSEHIKYSNIGG